MSLLSGGKALEDIVSSLMEHQKETQGRKEGEDYS